MDELKINIKTPVYPLSLQADGTPLELKREKGGNYSCSYSTDNEYVQLTVSRILEINGKFWFLWAMLTFFISFLGIFNPPYDKRCLSINYRLTVKVSGDSEIFLKVNRPAAGKRAIECETECPCNEEENVYFTDEQAKKRLKALKIIKPIIWVVAVIFTAAITIYCIVNN